MMRRILEILEKGDDSKEAYILCGVIFAASFTGQLANCHAEKISEGTGARVRATVATLVYNKAMVASLQAAGTQGFDVGNVVNLLSSDAEKLAMGCRTCLMPVVLFPVIIVVLILIFTSLGLIALPAISLILVVFIFCAYVAIGQLVNIKGFAEKNDTRVGLMKQVLQGIRVLKAYCWEEIFEAKAQGVYRDQLYWGNKFLGNFFLLLNVVIMMAAAQECLVMLTFVYTKDEYMKASVLLPAFALFAVLQGPLIELPTALQAIVNIVVSCKRIDDFLNTQNLVPIGKLDEASGDPEEAIRVTDLSVAWHTAPPEAAVKQDQDGNGEADGGSLDKNGEGNNSGSDDTADTKGVTVHVGVTAEKEDKAAATESSAESAVPPSPELTHAVVQNVVLQNVSFSLKRGSLTALVGQVACGKTSLLEAIIGQAHVYEGSVSVAKDLGFAWASQQACVFNASVKDNILFGQPYDEAFYRRVVEACCLSADFLQWPAGDSTEIGERGINISGGQKQRVALARVCYSKRPLVLLDDPLSAVDAHVGETIFKEMLEGICREFGCTVLMATHQLQHLQRYDRIIVLEEGTVALQGTYDEVLKLAPQLKNEEFGRLLCNASSLSSEESEKKEEEIEEPTKEKPAALSDPSLLEAEDRKTGVVSFDVLRTYFGAMYEGSCCYWDLPLIHVGVIVLIYVLYAFIAYWIDNPDAYERDKFVTTHVVLVLLATVVIYMRGEVSTWRSSHAGQVIHDALLRAVLYQPTKFFDVTPLGRIINRFSIDLEALLILIPLLSCSVIALALQAVGILIFLCAQMPVFTPVAVIAIGVLYILQASFRPASVQLKRVEAISRSPVFAHFYESADGIDTVRAYGMCESFTAKCHAGVDTWNRAAMTSNTAMYAFSLKINIITVLVQAASICLVVLLREHIAPGKAGVIFLVTGQLIGVLTIIVRLALEVERGFSSLERVLTYSDLTPESVLFGPVAPVKPPSMVLWEPSIEFENVVLRYKSDGPAALTGLTFKIETGEKVGICGRTGAGKSSVMVSLLRMVQIESGCIKLGGLLTETLSLRDLRSAVAIIPQDPFIFKGSLRFNLDPNQEHGDAALNEAMRQTMLTEGGLSLDDELSDSGSNLSVGQMQLLCLARALLSRTRILVLDEATASVDAETDDRIQQLIIEEFAARTVMTIAHRLHTLARSDRILVLGGGQLVESGTPSALMADETSAFYGMVSEGGDKNIARVHEILGATRERSKSML